MAKKRIKREIGSFLRQYGRRKNPGWDPNDRQYDRKMEELIKNMDPTELSAIISGDSSDITSEMDDFWFNCQPISEVKFMFNESEKLDIETIKFGKV